MLFVLGTILMFSGLLASPFLTLRPVTHLQVAVSGLLFGFGLVIILKSVAW